MYVRRLLICLCLLVGLMRPAAASPFGGTTFIDPDIITSADPTSYAGLTYAGRGDRWMYDRRSGWVYLNAYLFDATFAGGLTVEVQVNPEFGGASAAQHFADKYAREIGRLPAVLFDDLQTVWIHQGVQPFGGGNNNLLIHTGQAALYEQDGILEETLVHEGSHTSLDADHAASPGWLAAQQADPDFISTYAQDNPTREDIAESFLTWLAVRHRAERISPSLANTITNTIPNRLAYFDAQGFDLYPITALPADLDNDGDIDGVDLAQFFSSFTGPGGGPPVNPAADLDHDNDVDGVDLAQAFSLFTGPLTPTNAPEPGTLALVVLGGLSLCRRRFDSND